MKVIDCFIFYNELDMLKCRLYENYNIVDYFVLVESNKSFSNNPKQLIFEENKNLFSDFLDKIIHIKVDDMPDGCDAWRREYHQRDCIKRGLDKVPNLNDDDLILISDVDEIIRNKTIQKLKNSKHRQIYNLHMDLYYYNLETKSSDADSWRHVRAGPYGLIKNYDKISNLRRKNFEIIGKCGWHLSYFGGAEKIKNKIQNFSHQEFNKSIYVDADSIQSKIDKKQDIFGRNCHGKFNNIPIEKNDDLPLYYSCILFPSLKPLTYMGIRYNTDNSYFHLFSEFYNDYFKKIRTSEITILEIGVYEGRTLKLLEDYFPNSKLYGIDTRTTYVEQICDERIKTYHCTQDDFEKIDSHLNGIKFDIIIDDGTHQTIHQQKSLGHMFRYLNPSGIYICEDLHTSYDKGGLCNTNISTLDMLENYVSYTNYDNYDSYCLEPTIKSDCIPSEQLEYLNDNIESVEIFKRDKNAIRCWKCKKNNVENSFTCECGVDLSINSHSITSVIVHK